MDKLKHYFVLLKMQLGKIRVVATDPEYKKDRPYLIAGILLGIYVWGIIATLWDSRVMGLSVYPSKVFTSLTSWAALRALLFLAFAAGIIHLVYSIRMWKYRDLVKDDRDFYIRKDGVYGTAGKMDMGTMMNVFDLKPEAEADQAEGDILGYKNGYVISKPKNSYLAGHVAVYGTSGSMKSRTILRAKIHGAIMRNESIICTDPKSEFFQEYARYLAEKHNYCVRALNLVDLMRSHRFQFMKDLERTYVESGKSGVSNLSIQIVDAIIRNTSTGAGIGAAGDPFWDSAESNLLKALILYQFSIAMRGMGPLHFGECYNLLLSGFPNMAKQFQALAQIDSTDLCLAPWSVFAQAGDRLIPNIITGLANRLQLFQDIAMQDLVKDDQIDLELPAKQKCAYFVIMSDQHGAFNFISCLFFDMLFNRLVRYADTHKDSGVVNILLDEFPNIGMLNEFGAPCFCITPLVAGESG